MEFPALRKAYDEYKNKGFEIYGVAIGDKKENFENVLDTSDDCAANKYGITSIPTNFLVDNNGNIIAKNLKGEEVINKLKELFNGQ